VAGTPQPQLKLKYKIITIAEDAK